RHGTTTPTGVAESTPTPAPPRSVCCGAHATRNMDYPSLVNIVEVGPRDGLQNERQNIATATNLALIRRLEGAGLRQIESAAFVSPKWVPQMADHSDVMREVMRTRKAGVGYPVLVPNLKGLEAALAVGVEEVAIFAAA